MRATLKAGLIAKTQFLNFVFTTASRLMPKQTAVQK
jgi:hypothetical protein